MRKYVTKQGDTWDMIALRELGSERLVSELMSVNLENIPTVIFKAGVELDIPEAKLRISEKLPPWMKT